MVDRGSSGPVGRLGVYSTVMGIGTFGIGYLVIMGWAFDIEVLRSFIPGMIPMKMITAAGFMLAGVSLSLLQSGLARYRAGRWVAWGCAFIVVLTGLISLLEYASGADLWAGLGLGRSPITGPPGAVQAMDRMALNTAFNFILMGFSLILLKAQIHGGRRPAVWLIGLGAIVAFAELAGYVYGVSGLHSVTAGVKPMSLPSALAGVCLFVGLWLTLPEKGLRGALAGKGSGGEMARRLLLPIVLVPVVLELLLTAGRNAFLLEDHTVSGLQFVLQTVIFLWLLRIAAVSMNRSEEAQRALASFPKLNPNPVVEADLAGRVSYVNPAAETLFPDLRGKGRDHAWLSAWEEAIRGLTAGAGRTLEREVQVDGRWYQQSMWYVEENKTVRIYSMDVTEKRRAMESLRESESALRNAHEELEQRVRTRTSELIAQIAEREKAEGKARSERKQLYDVLGTLPVYVILLSPDYRIPYANTFFRERFGESGGKRCFEYLFGRSKPCEICHTFKVLETNAPLEWEWTGPDGRNYSIYDFPFTDTDGSRLILEMGIDVTEEKRLREGLEKQTGQLRLLAKELTLAEQRERRRLAQILHDHVQQLLVGAKLKLSTLRPALEGDSLKRIGEVDDLLTQSIDASRTLTAELNPPILRGAGLIAALQWLGRWMKEKYGLEVTLSFATEVPEVHEDLSILLFQSVKELLFNAAKHAKVGEARIHVAADSERVRIVVSDDGAGYDSSRLTLYGGQTGGIGLISIRERLGTIGGSMNIQTSPGAGTLVTLESPIRARPMSF